jgi:hypothetical protein
MRSGRAGPRGWVGRGPGVVCAPPRLRPMCRLPHAPTRPGCPAAAPSVQRPDGHRAAQAGAGAAALVAAVAIGMGGAPGPALGVSTEQLLFLEVRPAHGPSCGVCVHPVRTLCGLGCVRAPCPRWGGWGGLGRPGAGGLLSPPPAAGGLPGAACVLAVRLCVHAPVPPLERPGAACGAPSSCSSSRCGRLTRACGVSVHLCPRWGGWGGLGRPGAAWGTAS